MTRPSDTDQRIGAPFNSVLANATASLPSAAGDIDTVDDVSIVCHEGPVPGYVETEMDRLYGNIHCSLSHLKVYDGFSAITHTYVARRRQEIVALLLFRLEGRQLQVLNEGMQLDAGEINRFARYAFSSFPAVDVISFHAVQADIDELPFPHQRHVCTADIVLPLPELVDAYLASLGKNTRRNLRRYMDKLKRSHPSFRFEIFDKDAASEEQVRAIIELNRTRISGKNKSFGIDGEIERIVALAKACGMVGVATIDGRICGGTIGYMAGKNYFFKVIAHDPQYNEFSAGILCCYLTISECIARGCAQYNFMWNEYEYKFALGAMPRELAHFAIYRSRLHMLRQARRVVSLAADDYRHKASALLEKTGREHQLNGSQRLAFHALDGLRRVKRVVTGRPGR